MSDIRLTCAQTPLRWPANVALTDLTTCQSCGVRVTSQASGSLQVLTRRAGDGVGDGVTIDESATVAADYRGQRYAFEEAVFHTPGLHVFPGQSDVYPAEYHIHLRTFTAPQRAITLVIPVSHKVSAGGGAAYFAAIAARPDPAAKRPMLETILMPGSKIVQYQGPDIRGRTADVSANTLPQCAPTAAATERQFLLVLDPASIRATDLERIPREGSLSTDPRDLPAPGVKPTQTVLRDQLLRAAVLAEPGILGPATTREATTLGTTSETTELECKPLKVVDGRDVVDVDGKPVDILKLLGIRDVSGGTGPGGEPSAAEAERAARTGRRVLHGIAVFIGLLLADKLFGLLWSWFFEDSGGRLTQWEPLKIWVFLGISLTAAGYHT